jgi:hypothetical protein
LCFSFPLSILGKQIACDDVVVGLEEMIEVTPYDKRRFGTAGPFPILFTEA